MAVTLPAPVNGSPAFNDVEVYNSGGFISVRTNDNRTYRLVDLTSGQTLCRINDQTTAQTRADAMVSAGQYS